MPAFTNPFDYFIDTICSQENTGPKLYKHYLNTENSKVMLQKQEYSEAYKEFKNVINSSKNDRQVSRFLETYLILQRGHRNYVRNIYTVIARIINQGLISVVLLLLYFNIGSPDKIDTLYMNFISFFFNTSNQLFVNGIFTTLTTVPLLKEILKREYDAKLYRVSSFYLALLGNNFTICFMSASFLSFTTFWAVRLKNDFITFLCFYAINLISYMLGSIFSVLVGTLFSLNTSMALAPLIFIFFQLLGGFYKSNEEYPVFIKWLTYTSPYKYTMELYIASEEDFSSITETMRESLQYTIGTYNCIIILASIYVFFFILSYLSLKRYVNNN